MDNIYKYALASIDAKFNILASKIESRFPAKKRKLRRLFCLLFVKRRICHELILAQEKQMSKAKQLNNKLSLSL